MFKTLLLIAVAGAAFVIQALAPPFQLEPPAPAAPLPAGIADLFDVHQADALPPDLPTRF
jgi:hypothetical protein